MRTIELFPGKRMSGKFIGMPSMPLPVATGRLAGSVDGVVLRRIDDLIRVKATSRLLPVRREREFWQVIDDAHVAVAQGEPDDLTSVILALDLLSLELCDE